ncbi:hypothetical protein B0I21_106192 [Sphingobacterium paludis]|uniref:MFS transporter n=2 Tax=Sphingobacterium paludis TaxID=1476465 RepID=A0A4R7CYV6_9SPHI|nr:hypothetical protein B0I21_106192 [Sphingobacterium paludis]
MHMDLECAFWKSQRKLPALLGERKMARRIIQIFGASHVRKMGWQKLVLIIYLQENKLLMKAFGSRKIDLGKAPYVVQMLLLALAAFGCYTSMYAYRKAFTAAMFAELPVLGIDYKVWLVIAQVMGYMLSKFYGIKFVAELGQRKRGVKLLVLIGLAWIALLGFAVTPAPYNILFMFMNGLPLGMIWGIVFSYLEGRRATEFLAAVMSVSLVFASGFVKSLARFLMEHLRVTESWMPFATGLLFVLPLLLFTTILERVPPPDAEDKALRTERKPMTHTERISFLKSFWPGLAIVVLIYLLFTMLRDVRDNFEVEIWADVGVTDGGIYFRTDTFIALLVLALMSLMICVKGNVRAFSYIHMMLFFGCMLAAGVTYCFQNQLLDSVTWMVLTGLGLYMVYIPFNAIFFERFLAAFKVKGNIGFLMYVADSVGYLGSVFVLLVRELGLFQASWGSFFQIMVLFGAGIGAIAVALSAVYFRQKYRRHSATMGDMEFAK